MPTRYKLICMDLDGTLLDEQKRVSPKAKECLKKAREMGVQIALLSGRMPLAIEMIEEQIGFSCIKASSAGTYILMDGKCISSQTLLPKIVLEIYYNYAKKHGIPLWVYQDTRWFVTEVDSYVKHEIQLIHYEPEVVDIHILAKQWEKDCAGPNKILLGAEETVIQQLKEELEAANLPGINFAKSSEVYLEIYPEGADKGSAVLTICDVLGITPQEVIAFGDQELDVPMLKVSGLGVAMGNAPMHVKAAADVVTRSNEEDGVALALEKYVLN